MFDGIEREFEPKIRRWNRIKDIWESMLDDLYNWSLSYCHFAPNIDPWAAALDPVKATIFDQNVNPGIFKEREKHLLKHFGISFLDIFKHETFEFEVKNSSLWFSQELIEFLIEEIYPQCRPFNHLTAELIKKRGMFHAAMKNPGNCEVNPELHIPHQKFVKFYNSKYGEGRYESKYPPTEIMTDLFAKPWNWDTFKYNKI